jgi:hypothetical protein
MQSPVDDFLARAQTAFRSGNLSGRSGDDAFSLYRSALDATPDSASLPLPTPSPPVTVPANVALPTSQATPVAEPAAPARSLAPISTTRVSLAPTPQIDRARARLAASQLLAPVDDSAANYLRRAREAGEDETRLKITATDLGARLLDQSHQALLAGSLEAAQQDYNDAAALDREFELGLPDLEVIGRLLNDAHQAASPEPRRSMNIAPASEAAVTASESAEGTAPPPQTKESP